MDEREAMDRLHAADPAVGREPDDARLAPLVEARRARDEDQTADTPAATVPGERAVPDELAARRSRRLLPVAAAVAAALAVGSVGYGVGRAVDTPPPAALPAVQGTSQDATEQAGPTAPMTDMRAGAAETMFSPSIGFAGSGRMSFTSSGLSNEGGTASAWAFDGAGVFSEEAAARVAEVFGVEGEVRREGGWNAGRMDGTGPTLNISPDAAVTVYYSDPALYAFIEDVAPVPLPEPRGEGSSGSEDGAADSGEAAQELADAQALATQDQAAQDEPAHDQATQDDLVQVEPEPLDVIEPMPAPVGPVEEGPSAVEPAGQAPDGPAGTLYETLDALGLDPESAEYATQEHWAGDQVTSVVAHQLADGTRTGYTWHADVVDGEVLSFSGPLAPLVALGEYDVVSPAEAAQRLSDPRFGGAQVHSGDMEIMPFLPEASGRSWDDPPAAPPSAGSSIPWPVTAVTIVAAEPALTQHYTDDGGTLVLPAYELSDADGRTWSVLAVADHELAF